MNFETLKFETLKFEKNGAIGTLTINRPQALNALNTQVVRELGLFVSEVKGDNSLRCLIVTGGGEKAFVAGADIKEMSGRPAGEGRAMAEEGQKVFQALEELPFPTIAAVNGFALGGGLELAMSCDFIIASKSAKLGLPEVTLGLIPGYGGTQRLARFVGKSLARMIVLTGDIYSAEQCEKWGLVALTVEAAEFAATVQKIATKISERSPRALALAKDAIRRGSDATQAEGMRIEAELFHAAFNSQDKIEGTAAFVEKRPAKFSGA
jgi:enoyl-CoA hydratase